MKSINIDGKRVYHNGIIHTDEFIRLYQAEKPIAKFSSKVTIETDRPFTTILTEQRKSFVIKEKRIVAIRIIKEYKEVEFISKIYKWGKIHIPREIINLLKIKNKEKIDFQIISKDEILEPSDNPTLDISDITNERIKVIPRANNLITIYSKQKVPLTIPRLIELSPKLFELFFLIHGDGHYKTKLFFVNKNPELIQFVMEQFEKILRIPKDEWKARILLTNLDKQKEAKGFWKKRLNLNEKQFYSVSKAKFNTAKYGNLRIIIDKTIVSSVFRFIFDEVKKRVNETNSFYALDGLLCAEGGAQIDKIGLHKISLSFNKGEKAMFEEILNKTHLLHLCRLEPNSMYSIKKWDNLYLFFRTFLIREIVPFKYHTQRKEDALKGFLNHSFTNTLIKYLLVLKEKDKLKVKEFSNLLNIREDSLLNTIRKQQYGQFIKIEGKGIKNNPFIISIIDEGKLFLEIVNKMERLLKQDNLSSIVR